MEESFIDIPEEHTGVSEVKFEDSTALVASFKNQISPRNFHSPQLQNLQDENAKLKQENIYLKIQLNQQRLQLQEAHAEILYLRKKIVPNLHAICKQAEIDKNQAEKSFDQLQQSNDSLIEQLKIETAMFSNLKVSYSELLKVNNKTDIAHTNLNENRIDLGESNASGMTRATSVSPTQHLGERNTAGMTRTVSLSLKQHVPKPQLPTLIYKRAETEEKRPSYIPSFKRQLKTATRAQNFSVRSRSWDNLL